MREINTLEGYALADKVRDLLDGTLNQLAVVGDFRLRRKADKLIMVAVPSGAPSLLARLDNLVISGRIARSSIVNPYHKKWTDQERLFFVDQFPCTLHVATPDNFGYLVWLHTGPSDACAYAIAELGRRQHYPYALKGGYFWHRESGRPVRTPTEGAVFAILGSQKNFHARERSVDAYRRHLFFLLPPPPERLGYSAFEDIPQPLSLW